MSQEKHFTHKYHAHITEMRENKISNQKTRQQGEKNNFGQKNLG